MMGIKLPFRIFSVDPATTISGWSVLVVESLDPLVIKIEAHGKLDGDKLFRTKKEMAVIFQKQFCVLDAIEEAYTDLVTQYKPDIIVSEGSFGFVHLSALIALTLAINALRRVSQKVINKDIVIVPPTITKLAFTGKGSADKDMMRQCYEQAEYLHNKTMEDISEHEIDSIGHAIGYIRRDLLGTVIQISAKDKRKKKREKEKQFLP